MAVKKSKKDANSINSRLALVMKSGKGVLKGNFEQRNLEDGNLEERNVQARNF